LEVNLLFPLKKFFYVNSLKHNLLNISKLYDKCYKIIFDHASWLIIENNKVIYIGNRKVNVYKIKINAYIRIKNCLVASINDNFVLLRRLGHINMDILCNLVKGVTHIALKNKNLCKACQMGKQVKTYF